MNFMLFSERSNLISTIHSIAIVIVLVIGVDIGVSHAGVIPPSSSLELEPAARSLLLDTFKTKLLDHLGLEAPPVTGFTNKTLAREALREQINDFLKKLKENEDEYERHASEKHFHPPGTEQSTPLKFESTQQTLRIPVSQDTKASESSNFVTFTADKSKSRRLVTSGNDKIKFKSAVLRLRVGQRRNRLRHRTPHFSGSLNVTVSLVLGSGRVSAVSQKTSSIQLKSFIARASKFKSIRINLSSHLSRLSNLMSYYNNRLTFEISVQVPKDKNSTRRKRKITRFSKTRRRDNRRRKKFFSRSLPSFIKIVPTLKSTVIFNNTRGNRTKRDASSDCERQGFCRRQSTYISFAEIGWDSWILSPEGYTAYFCAGSCPSMFKAASAFTGIKGMLHELDPSRIPEPSCAPTGYRPISLLYLAESQTLVETNYPDMVVTGCRCF